MIRKSVFIAVIVTALSVVALPQRAEAGFIIFDCYASLPLSGLTSAPNPNVGCVMNWFPGGNGVRARFAVSYGCTPNCVVVPEALTTPWVSINTPSIGNMWREIMENCLGRSPIVSVGGTAESQKYASGRTRSLVPDQTIGDAAAGPIGIFCPGGPVGALVESDI